MALHDRDSKQRLQYGICEVLLADMNTGLAPEIVAAGRAKAPELDDATLVEIYTAMARADQSSMPWWVVGYTVAFTGVVLFVMWHDLWRCKCQ